MFEGAGSPCRTCSLLQKHVSVQRAGAKLSSGLLALPIRFSHSRMLQQLGIPVQAPIIVVYSTRKTAASYTWLD